MARDPTAVIGVGAPPTRTERSSPTDPGSRRQEAGNRPRWDDAPPWCDHAEDSERYPVRMDRSGPVRADSDVLRARRSLDSSAALSNRGGSAPGRDVLANLLWRPVLA